MIKKSFKNRVVCATLISVVFTLCGCSAKTSVATVFGVATGDKVRIEYDTTSTDNSLYSEDAEFYVGIKGENPIVSGCFSNQDTWDYYSEAVKQTEEAEVLECVETVGQECIYYAIDSEVGMQYIKIFRVPESNTFVILASLKDKTEVDDNIERLTFSIE